MGEDSFGADARMEEEGMRILGAVLAAIDVVDEEEEEEDEVLTRPLFLPLL